MFGQQRPVTEFPSEPYFANPALPSPGFHSLTDNFCDNFFKHELGTFSHPSCSIPSTLPLEGNAYHSNFIETPLTPQSSHQSLCSPLSHATLGSSPEPNLEIDYSRPHSQTSVHSIGSPNQADLPTLTSEIHSYSSASSACTSPLTHDPECTLNIAASLELVAQGGSAGGMGYSYLPQDGRNMSASYPADPYAAQLPTSVGGYGTEAVEYSQYECDFLHLMPSEADELLASPFSVKETKPSLSQLPSPCTPATTPIH